MEHISHKLQAASHKLQAALLFLALCPMPFAHSQQYGWRDLTSKLPDFQYDTIYNIYGDTIVASLMDLCFISDYEGWIVTSNGNPEEGGAVLHTTDGGENWEAHPIGTGCLAIQMVDQNTGYAGGWGGIIWKTTDGGATWNYHGTITTTLTDIEFPPQPADTGYACGLDGKTCMITPSGVTLIDPGIVGSVYHLSFPESKDEGWFVGEGWGMLRHFLNGQWLADQIHISGYHLSVDFVDNQNGWVVGDRILHTTDGQDWIEQTNHPALVGGLMNVCFLNLNEGWAAGTVGQVLKTTDGGASWVKEDLGTNELLDAVQFTSASNGYIVGANKKIFKYGTDTGIQNGSINTIRIFPNPVKDKLVVCSLSPADGKVEVVDSFGRTLIVQNLKTETWVRELNISNLPRGIYFIRISFENQTFVKKIIKI